MRPIDLSERVYDDTNSLFPQKISMNNQIFRGYWRSFLCGDLQKIAALAGHEFRQDRQALPGRNGIQHARHRIDP